MYQSSTVGTLWLFNSFTINKSKIPSWYNSFWKYIGGGLLNRCFAARSGFSTIFVWYQVPEASPKAVPNGRIRKTALLPVLCGLSLTTTQLASRQRNLIEVETWLPRRLCPEVQVQRGPTIWLCEAQACIQARAFRHGQDVSVAALHPSGTKKMHKGNYHPILLHHRSQACQGDQKGAIDRTWGGEAEEREPMFMIFSPLSLPL